MRISDWISDVCSSDLVSAYVAGDLQFIVPPGSYNGGGSPNSWLITKSTPLIAATAGTDGDDAGLAYVYVNVPAGDPTTGRAGFNNATEIGTASGRERGCTYV